MKHHYLFLTVLSLSGFCGFSYSQDDQLTRDFAPIKSELQKWDPVRGEWLAESMLAVSQKKPIPDRTFPEDFTPSEMIRMVPPTNRQNIQNSVNTNINSQSSTLNRDVWNNMSGFMQRSSCEMKSGRSYGDPHLSTYDGKTFSFQTVGEFVFTKSGSGNVEVQTRQKASGDDFSLNTAVAMNVSGDRVCIYADEKPDSDLSNPLRIEGSSVRVQDRTYYLSHGGTIRNDGKEYIVTWPTGEKISVQIVKNSKFDFINITTHIYPCASDGYEGLMGNANGNPNDDIDTRNNRYDYGAANRFNTAFGGQTASMSNEAEKEYLIYLAKEFGQAWRVNGSNTLFDYGPGQSTEYFTDFSFPRYHRTVRDLSQTQRDNARRDCETRGIRGSELEGCIFDRAYVGIDPNPRPVFRDPTAGAVLSSVPIGRTVRNVNPPETDPRNPASNGGNGSSTGNGGRGKLPASKATDVKPVVIHEQATGGANVSTTKAPAGNKTGSDKPVVKPVSIDQKPAGSQTEKTPVSTKPSLPAKEPVSKPAPVVKPTPIKSPESVKPVVSTPAPKPSVSRPIAPVKSREPVKPVENIPVVTPKTTVPATKNTTPATKIVRP